MLVPREEFRLDPAFLNTYQDSQPDFGPLGYVVYKRTYALEKPDGSMEEFWETCQRVIEGTYQIQKGHCRRLGLPWDDDKAQHSAQEAYERMFALKWLPPGRGLSKMGTETVFQKGAACLMNCAMVSTRNIGSKDIPNAFSAPFCWLMDFSMLGVGVGMDTLGAVHNPPTIHSVTDRPNYTFLVGDSREGWVDYLRDILEAYADPTRPFPLGDFSRVRPKGSKIKGFGGTASGPESLELLTTRVCARLDKCAGSPITVTGIVDIANSIGECVVAGGVRRTAEIMFGDSSDEEFLSLQDPSNPDMAEWPRWASNNSVVVSSGSDFTQIAKRTAMNGEPGYLFLDNARAYGRMREDELNHDDDRAIGANPCMEQTLHDRECCCLVETFPSRCDSYEDYQRTIKFAYLYAKTVTLIPTHDEVTNAVILRNRRIGCSMTGIQDNIAKIGMRAHLDWCDQGYNYIRALDHVYSDWLCVPRSIKHTSVKPSGTVSKLVGVREGIHQSKGEYEIQSMRINDDSPLLEPLREAGYKIEQAVKERNTVVVYFPMHYPGHTQMTMWQQLEMTALMQYYWANNQVSVTIDFDQETEGHLIVSALEMYGHRLKGVSFLPRDSKEYVQPPKRVVTQQEYEEYRAHLKPLDLSTLHQVHEAEERFCDGSVCELPKR